MLCPFCSDDHLNRVICVDCGALLAADERHYLGGRCNGCENEHHERIAVWCAGGEDAELDQMFGVGDCLEWPVPDVVFLPGERVKRKH